MLTSYLLPLTIILQIIFIYVLSRYVITSLFLFLRGFFHQENLIYAIVSLIYFPGTIVHEISHWLGATVLLLPVYEVHIFPHFEKNHIKLGSVIYGKKDVVRGMLVGIAPLFFALIFFWVLAKFNLFPSNNLWQNIFFGYVIFGVSSTMFSSRQDLRDLAFVIPIVIIIVAIFYIFDIRVDYLLKNDQLENLVKYFLTSINFYLLFSLVVNILLIGLFKFYRFLTQK